MTYHINYHKHLPHKEDLIVDLGCSEGLFLEYLARHRFKNIVGVDLDADALTACKARLAPFSSSHVTIIHQDIRDYISLQPENSLPCVVMNDVIEHFPKDAILSLGKAIYRVLRPGGVFIAKTGNIENPLNLGLYVCDFTHEIAFSKHSLRQFCILIGFDPQKVFVAPVRHSTTNILDLLARIPATILSLSMKLAARIMRMRISETSKLIYCKAEK